MSNNLVYIAWDAKSISKRVQRAVQQADPNTIKQTSRNVQRGNDIMQSWLEEHDGDLLFSHGDEGWASLPGQKIEELQVVHEQMQDAWGDDISIGVGLDLNEAKKALDLAIKRGSGNILFYTPEIEEEQEKEENKNPILDSLLDKATPEDAFTAGSPIGGDQAAQEQAASPVTSASEHSQDEQAIANAAAVPSPAVDDVEGKFHNMAQAGEQQEAERQAQLQAQAQNAEQDPGQQVEELKQQVAGILAKVKKQAPILEQMKQQAPEAYAAITSMVQAMISMARELMDIQGGQQAQQNQGQPQQMTKEEEQLHFPGMGPPPRETHPNDPNLVKIILHHGGAGEDIEGYIPSSYYPPGIEPEGIGGGYQEAAHILGNNVIKIQHHRNENDANRYLKRLERLKRLRLSTVVPIMDAGHFAVGPRMFSNIPFGGDDEPVSGNSYFTYEIMKKLHHLSYSPGIEELRAPLSAAGYRHRDYHGGNRMQDSDGNPMLIDLESIVTIPRESDGLEDPDEDLDKAARKSFPTPDDALVPVTLTRQNKLVRGKIPHKWAKLSRSPLSGGYQNAAHLLGVNSAAEQERSGEEGGKYVLKIQHHSNVTRAKAYVNRIKRFKKLGISTMVPILDVGLFGRAHNKQWNIFGPGKQVGHGYFTFEVMKKLHPPTGVRSAMEVAAHGLREAGYMHVDLHDGNIMQDTAGVPQVIDLESIKTLKSDKLPGGLADKKTPKDFDPKSLKQGVSVEKEHTTDAQLAQEIAMDHLTEDPKYYQKLKTMERKKSEMGEAMGEREFDPSKPVPKNGKLDKAAVGPMPGSQGNLRTAAHRRLPHGTEHIEIKDQGRGGNKHSRVTTVDHVTPDGKLLPAHRENNTARVKGVNIAEAPHGRLHAVSALAPSDGKGGQSAAAPQPEKPKGTQT